MLDVFTSGSVDRMSPEAPIPVLCPTDHRQMLGGIGNVVANLASLGAIPSVLSVIGSDDTALEITQLLQNLGCQTDTLIKDKSRPTTRKTRYLSGGKHLLRVDEESTHNIDENAQNPLLEHAETLIKNADAVILSDYKKGVLTPELTQKVIRLAKQADKPVIVDPKGQDYTLYKGATIVTPNKKGLSDGTGMPVSNDVEITKAAQKLISDHAFEHVLATRSEEGMSLISKNGETHHIKAQAKDVYDVSGAGDTVVATLALGLAAGLDMKAAVELSNIAASIVVGKSGTSTLSFQELQGAL